MTKILTQHFATMQLLNSVFYVFCTWSYTHTYTQTHAQVKTFARSIVSLVIIIERTVSISGKMDCTFSISHNG